MEEKPLILGAFWAHSGNFFLPLKMQSELSRHTALWESSPPKAERNGKSGGEKKRVKGIVFSPRY